MADEAGTGLLGLEEYSRITCSWRLAEQGQDYQSLLGVISGLDCASLFVRSFRLAIGVQLELGGGRGHGVVMNSAYHVIQTVSSGNDRAPSDVREFFVIN